MKYKKKRKWKERNTTTKKNQGKKLEIDWDKWMFDTFFYLSSLTRGGVEMLSLLAMK